MKHDNPCLDCGKRGCGMQAQCEEYLAFYQRNRERNAENIEQSRINAYVTEAIKTTQRRKHSSTGRYRPKGRW